MENPGAGNREVAAATKPYHVSHVFAAGVRARYESGKLTLDPQMLLVLDGKPTGGRLEQLAERRRRRLEANR
jgi:hypothetical protein